MKREVTFYQQATFSLSPAEFLAFVWVYRNEIQPIFERCKSVDPAEPKDLKDYYSTIRHGILDGDLQQTQLTPEEIKFFQVQSKKLFAPFEESQDPVRKPASSLIYCARSSMTSLITEYEKGKLIGLESSLIKGNITFSIAPPVATILKRPY